MVIQYVSKMSCFQYRSLKIVQLVTLLSVVNLSVFFALIENHNFPNLGITPHAF